MPCNGRVAEEKEPEELARDEERNTTIAKNRGTTDDS